MRTYIYIYLNTYIFQEIKNQPSQSIFMLCLYLFSWALCELINILLRIPYTHIHTHIHTNKHKHTHTHTHTHKTQTNTHPQTGTNTHS